MDEPHPKVLTYLAAIAAFNRNDIQAVQAPSKSFDGTANPELRQKRRHLRRAGVTLLRGRCHRGS